MYRTADFGEECDEGEAGCMQWHKVRAAASWHRGQVVHAVGYRGAAGRSVRHPVPDAGAPALR